MVGGHLHRLGQVRIYELLLLVVVRRRRVGCSSIRGGIIQEDWSRNNVEEALRVLGPLGGGRRVGHVNTNPRPQEHDHLGALALVVRIRIELFHLGCVVFLVKAVAWHSASMSMSTAAIAAAAATSASAVA